jgi:hypothetical protein
MARGQPPSITRTVRYSILLCCYSDDACVCSLAENKFRALLENASQPRHTSGNACIKLCYFIEQCRTSTSSSIQDIVFSETTASSLFNFYIEWNEKNQNRSMRQVLELSASLIARNPEKQVSQTVKSEILRKTLSAIARDDAQALVKPSFKSLECFLGKDTISPEELLQAYRIYTSRASTTSSSIKMEAMAPSWDSFILDVFYWLGPADVSPAAGKFLVSLFKKLKISSESAQQDSMEYQSSRWQNWIRSGLLKTPGALENVKNYLFSPLFKIDRPSSLAFLRDLNQQRPMSKLDDREIDAHAMLQLASMEVGQKSGLVEEPSW